MLRGLQRTLRSLMSSRKCREDRSAGFTLVELSVAMTISIILLLMMASIVTSDTKAETSMVNSANSASTVRLVFFALENDIQSADPLSTLSTISAYSVKLKMTIQPQDQLITWKYTYSPTTGFGTLTRQIGSAVPAVELTDITNGNPNSLVKPFLPVFTYYDHCAINLVNEAQATPASVSSATTAIQVTLSVNNVNSAPYGSTTTVHIMNKPPVFSQCG